MKKKKFLFPFFFFFFCNLNFVFAKDLQKGKSLFEYNCSVCHIGGTNIIIPEKNLKKETLETNGMNSLNAIIYQIINGKNGMPAFGGRLTEKQIEEIANYVLQESLLDFIE
jgi:cytochrome c6